MHAPRIHLRPPKINWKLYCTRKVFVLIGVVVVTDLIEAHYHIRVVGKLHEFGLSFLAEHLFFGIPFSGE